MVDTSVDLAQLRGTAQQLRDIADSDMTEFINSHSKALELYRQESSVNTVDGAPAGIFQDTVEVLDSGVRDVVKKAEAMKAGLIRLAEQLEAHADGVESDEADAAMQFSYGTSV